MAAPMGVFDRLHKTTKRRISSWLYGLSVGIPLLYLTIPAIVRYNRATIALSFDQTGFEQVIGEIRTGALKPDSDGRIVLPPGQAYLTNDGCAYVTPRGKDRLIFFPAEPLTGLGISARSYDGYVFCDADLELPVGLESVLVCPEGTRNRPFALKKYSKPHWYHAYLIHG